MADFRPPGLTLEDLVAPPSPVDLRRKDPEMLWRDPRRLYEESLQGQSDRAFPSWLQSLAYGLSALPGKGAGPRSVAHGARRSSFKPNWKEIQNSGRFWKERPNVRGELGVQEPDLLDKLTRLLRRAENLYTGTVFRPILSGETKLNPYHVDTARLGEAAGSSFSWDPVIAGDFARRYGDPGGLLGLDTREFDPRRVLIVNRSGGDVLHDVFLDSLKANRMDVSKGFRSGLADLALRNKQLRDASWAEYDRILRPTGSWGRSFDDMYRSLPDLIGLDPRKNPYDRHKWDVFSRLLDARLKLPERSSPTTREVFSQAWEFNPDIHELIRGLLPSVSQKVNSDMTTRLRSRGVDALLYNPERWEEFEVRVLNPRIASSARRISDQDIPLYDEVEPILDTVKSLFGPKDPRRLVNIYQHDTLSPQRFLDELNK